MTLREIAAGIDGYRERWQFLFSRPVVTIRWWGWHWKPIHGPWPPDHTPVIFHRWAWGPFEIRRIAK